MLKIFPSKGGPLKEKFFFCESDHFPPEKVIIFLQKSLGIALESGRYAIQSKQNR